MLWLAVAFVILLIFLTPRFLLACENASTADWGSRKVNRIAGFIYLLCKHLHHLQSDPLPIPESGGALVASNHISGLDPFLLIAASPRPLRFLIAREQYERFGLNWLFRLAKCIPVDREGRPERALREALTALEQGDVVAVFPHGKIHLDSDPPRKLKGGVVRLAQRTDSLIFPVRIDDVRGAGHTILAVVIPSYSRLKVFPAIDCSVMEHEECLSRLASLIEPKDA